MLLTIKHLTALARHEPSRSRIRLRPATRIGSLSLCSAVLAMLVMASGAAAASGVDVAAVEGQSFTGGVVSGLVACSLASATIDWGDGTKGNAPAR